MQPQGVVRCYRATPDFLLTIPGLCRQVVARRNDHSKEELQELVIAATRELVDRLGPTQVTARTIADSVGYTAGTLYTHFNNLQTILLHVNAINLVDLKQTIERASTGRTPPQSALLEMGFAYLDYAERHPHRFALMFTSNLPHGEDAPDYLQQNIDALFQLVEDELRKIAPDADDQTMELGVRSLWSGVHGVVSLSTADQLFTKRWRADRHILRTLVEQFLSTWPNR